MSIEMRIMEAIAEQVGKDVTVERVEIEKNNGTVRTGFIIKEVGSTLAPTIYFNPEDDEDIIFEHVMKAYNSCLSAQPDFDINELLTKEYVIANVVPVLANTSRNENRLKELVSREYADDISIVYRVIIDTDNSGMSSFLLKNNHLDYLDATEQEIYDASIANIQDKGEVLPMNSILGDDAPDTPLVVITNNSRCNGASMIFDKSVTKILKLMGDVYIIPSSIHELIAVGCENVDDDFVKFISDMIKTVNSTALEVEDFLSDYLYKYTEAGLEKVEVA